MKRKNADRRKLETRRCSENLRRLLTGFKSLLEHNLREESLTLPQLRLLKAVQQQTGVSSATLARTCMITPQTMQSILTRAEREGWIIRAKSTRNERILTASLTPLGEEVLERGLQTATRIEEQIWHTVSLSDLERLNETLGEGVERLNHLEQQMADSLNVSPTPEPVCLPSPPREAKRRQPR